MFDEELLRTFPSLDTSYSKFATSNHLASSWETPAIREIITQRREQLGDLDTVIQRMETILHKFREKREQVESSLKAHEGFISCIRRLPSEILIEIFTQCLPDERYLSPATDTAPLLLTRVCSKWREVALDTPRLWCSLSITEPREEVEERIPRYYEYWLKNAKVCSLSLNLNLITLFFVKSRKMPVIDLLRPYTTRCTDLTVSFGSALGLDRLLEEAPFLECLSLTGDLMELDEQISIAESSPRLHTVIIDTAAPDLELFSDWFILEWTNLTHLSVVFPPHADHWNTDESTGMFSKFLEMCPNLEHLVYSPLAIRKFHDTLSLTHSNLRILDICELYSDGDLLDELTLPNLRHLRVHEDVKNANTGFESLPEVSWVEGRGHHVFDMAIRGHVPGARSLFGVFNPGWAELTHIRLQSDLPMEAFSFMIPLQRCSFLEDLVVDSIFLTAPQYTPLTYSMLRSLTVVVSYGDFGALLDLLTLPSLRHLNLRIPDVSRWPRTNLKEFFSRSNCPLETFEVQGLALSFSYHEELASLIPTLRHLERPSFSIFTLTDLFAIKSSARIYFSYCQKTALFSIQDKPLTLLIPTDKAIMALARKPYQGPEPVEPVIEMTEQQSDEQWGRNVESWVAAHVIPSRVSLSDVPVTYDTMLEGKSVTFTPVKGNTYSPEWSRVTLEDGVRIIEMQEGVNGVIYVIDGTVKP